MIKKLGFDIDDTIADSVGLSVSLLNEYFDRDVKLEDVDGRFCDVYGIDQSLIEEFYKKYSDTIFRNIGTMPNAVEYINKWYDEGHEIVIITARPEEEAKEVTVNWLKEKGIKYHQLHFNEEKSVLAKEIGLDLFVDDFPKIAEAMFEKEITTLFMDLPKNRKNFTSSGIYRVKNWDEAYLVIEGFLKEGGK